VKKGIKSEVRVSSLEPSSAVNPIDWCGINQQHPYVLIAETYTFGYPPFDDGIQADKSTAQYEQHV